MDHVAIMRKEWNLIPKILSGEKMIESRWYCARFAPWGRIAAGDRVYFRDSGGPVVAKAVVSRVTCHEGFSKENLTEIIRTLGGAGGICFVKGEAETLAWLRNKRYGLLIYLEGARKVKPFIVDKSGYGNACAWMCVEDIRTVMKNGNLRA